MSFRVRSDLARFSAVSERNGISSLPANFAAAAASVESPLETGRVTRRRSLRNVEFCTSFGCASLGGAFSAAALDAAAALASAVAAALPVFAGLATVLLARVLLADLLVLARPVVVFADDGAFLVVFLLELLDVFLVDFLGVFLDVFLVDLFAVFLLDRDDPALDDVVFLATVRPPIHR